MSDTVTELAECLDRVEALLADVREMVVRGKVAPKAYSSEEVGLMADLHPNTIRKMVANGTLQRIPNTGRTIRISAAEVARVFGIRFEDGAA